MRQLSIILAISAALLKTQLALGPYPIELIVDPLQDGIAEAWVLQLLSIPSKAPISDTIRPQEAKRSFSMHLIVSRKLQVRNSVGPFKLPRAAAEVRMQLTMPSFLSNLFPLPSDDSFCLYSAPVGACLRFSSFP